jgi:exosortase C (VPDSG-CTERM-specific)
MQSNSQELIDPPEISATQPNGQQAPAAERRLWIFGGFVLLLCLAFLKPLGEWVRFSLAEERNSYLLIVPLITGYLIWTKRRDLRQPLRSSVPSAVCAALLGAAAFGISMSVADPINRLGLEIFAFLSFVLAGCFAFVGTARMREIAFPLSFLVFALPVAPAVAGPIEIFLQYTSAEVAYWMLAALQTPMLREGLDFLLPGISLHVAQECSGYNSSFALLVVSTVAGYMFLKSPLKRTFLSAVVIPLAILRNGFRITTIALLCVHVDPAMIHSYIHHHGGPIFFALSLIPFFMLLWWMRKTEAAKGRSSRAGNEQK